MLQLINRSDAASRMHSLLVGGDYADTDVVCASDDNGVPLVLRAHRCILAAASDVWRAMLASAPANAAPTVPLADTPPAAARALLHYAYAGESDVAPRDVPAVVAAADRFGLPGLRMLAERCLPTAVRVDNVAAVLSSAAAVDCDTVKRFAIAFMLRHFDAVAETDAFGDISPALLEELISSDDLVTESEESVLKAVIRWGLLNMDSSRRSAAPATASRGLFASPSQSTGAAEPRALIHGFHAAPLSMSLYDGSAGHEAFAYSLTSTNATPATSYGLRSAAEAPPAGPPGEREVSLRVVLQRVSPHLRLAHLPSEALRSTVVGAVVPSAAIVAALFEKLSAAEARGRGGPGNEAVTRTPRRRYANASASLSFRVLAGSALVTECGRAINEVEDSLQVEGDAAAAPIVAVIERSSTAEADGGVASGPQTVFQFVLEDSVSLRSVDVRARIVEADDAEVPVSAVTALEAAEVIIALVPAAEVTPDAIPQRCAADAVLEWLVTNATWAVTSTGIVLARGGSSNDKGDGKVQGPLLPVENGLPFGLSAYFNVTVDGSGPTLVAAATISNARLNPSIEGPPAANARCELAAPHAPPNPLDVFDLESADMPNAQVAQLADPIGGPESATGACCCTGLAQPPAGCPLSLVVVAMKLAHFAAVIVPAAGTPPVVANDLTV